jgi:DNA (cytosine-5)-methyltransferase 1
LKRSRSFIELFAGCGGMSLGLEAAGFELCFANEISPMAGITYAKNLLKDDEAETSNTIWLKSEYNPGDPKRLSENPFEIQRNATRDLNSETDLQGKLVIGDINQLNLFLKKEKHILEGIRKKNIDLVSGGPPCQSFSLAGRREKDNRRNKLPWAFIEFVELVQPKVVLLENVSGILRAFKSSKTDYYAWFELAKAFCLSNYIPICLHINAKYYGVPQNRPRFILLAIHKEHFKKLKKDRVLKQSEKFYLDTIASKGTKHRNESNYHFYELNSKRGILLFKSSEFLPSPKLLNENDFKSVHYAIEAFKNINQNDFPVNRIAKDEYHIYLESIFPRGNNYTVFNHQRRKHTSKIRNRFKFIKLIEEFENGEKVKLYKAIRTGSHNDLGQGLVDLINKKLNENGFGIALEEFLKEHHSRKHSQRALVKDKPAPATLSIPDDVCHYGIGIDRTLSVREMARIQSFPDWFKFHSKDTTGGKNRKWEVPNYTQVGNAVPPLLAKELGEWIETILKKLD